MILPDADMAFLRDRGIQHQSMIESGMTCVVFPDWRLPGGYDHATADLLVRLPQGYPDVAPDMWWFDPPIHPASGGFVQNTEYSEAHLGRTWQRWSRHFQAGQWTSGIDGLESYLALIQSELQRSVPEPVR